MSAASIFSSTSTPIFSGVSYTDAHVTLIGMLFISVALGLGAVDCLRLRPAQATRALAARGHCSRSGLLDRGRIGRMVQQHVHRAPNRLNRERPYIADNIALTRQAYGLDSFAQQEFPAETTVAAADPEHNQATLENIRLWDVGALQSTLTQLQEIRTYYAFPGIDIDRYQINGSLRQVMLAVRELDVANCPTPAATGSATSSSTPMATASP
jgi:uncharacterized protein